MTRLYIFSLLMCITGTAAVSLSNYFSLKSSCQSGFIDGEDMFYFVGSIDAVNVATRPNVVFELQQVASQFYDVICSVDLNTGTCAANQLKKCYCRSNINSTLEIVLNETANINYSGRLLQLSWLNGLDPANTSNSQFMPEIYAKANESLEVNGQKYQPSLFCNITFLNPAKISWCITDIKNVTLKIFSNGAFNSSINECATYTYFANLSENIFNISFEEHSGCKRNNSYQCFFHVSSSTSIMPTLEVSSITSIMPATEAVSLFSTSCSASCIGVAVGHGICSCLEIIVTVLVISMLMESKKQCYLILACTILTILELVQIALVIVNAVSEIECNCHTSIPVWGIMLLYQFIVNIILIVVDAVYLAKKLKCCTSNVSSRPGIILIILIFIHSVFGILPLPLISLLKGNASNEPQGNVPMREIPPENTDKARNKVDISRSFQEGNNKFEDKHEMTKRDKSGDESQVKYGKRIKLEPIKKIPAPKGSKGKKKELWQPEQKVKKELTRSNSEKEMDTGADTSSISMN